MSDSLPARPVSRVMTRVKRDQQVRRAVRRLATTAPHLDDPKYRPALVSLARTTLLVDRMYQALGKDSLLDEQGEFRSSIDVLRRMIGTQADLLKSLGLMPTSILPDSSQHRTLDAVFERIERVRAQRDEHESNQNPDPAKDRPGRLCGRGLAAIRDGPPSSNPG